jgi:hypothetical protein
MRRPLLVLEDVRTTPQRRLFTLFGVEWFATPYALLSLPFFCLLGIAAAIIGHRDGWLASRLLIGVAYGLMLYACNTIHSLGHIVGGTLLGAPMNALLLTATRDVNVYVGSRAEVPIRIRVGRAASGPLLNLLTGLLMMALGRPLHTAWLTIFGYFNLGVAIWTLMPIPAVDGWVIWKALFGRRKPAGSQ